MDNVFWIPVKSQFKQFKLSEILSESFESPLTKGMFEDIFVHHVYEHDECKINKDDIVVDIGSNIGAFCNYAIQKGAKKVFCFEPELKNFNCLQKNTNEKCIPICSAITEKSGSVTLYEDLNIGGHSIYNNDSNHTKTNRKVTVPSLSMNDLFSNKYFDKIDFLKIDTEGAEYNIFKGLSNYNLQRINKISIEWHHFIHDFKPYCEEVIKRLEPWFNSYRLDYRGGNLSMLYFWKKDLDKKIISVYNDKINFDKVIAHTSFLGHTGYANHSRQFFTALNDLIPVRVRNYAHCENLDYLTQTQKDMIIRQTWAQPPYEVGKPYVENENEKIVNIVLNESHHYYFYDKYRGPKIAYNVWESTRQIDQFFKQLLTFDQMWVPSKWQRDVTIEQGYPEDRIKIVPEGVDGNIFKPISDVQRPKYVSENRFCFMIFARWDYRKCVPEMIRSFLRTFDKKEPVDLIISVDNPFSVDNMNSTEERLNYYNFHDERIKVLHFPPFEEYLRYLQSGNVLLSCSRAEGWNLPLIEAIACGTVSICSDYGAQLEFAKGISHTVKIKEFRQPTDFFLNDTGKIPGVWAEPDFDHLEYVLRDVYENYESYKEDAIRKSEIVRSKFSWENAAKTAFDILKDLSVQNEKVHTIPKALSDVSHSKLRILIVVNELDNAIHDQDLLVYFLSKELVKNGYRITVFVCNGNSSDLTDELSKLNVKITYDRNEINEEDFDIVHLQDDMMFTFDSKFSEIPKLFCTVSTKSETNEVPKNINKYVAISERVKSNLENLVGAKNVSLVPYFVDTSLFSSNSVSSSIKNALLLTDKANDYDKQVIKEICDNLNVSLNCVDNSSSVSEIAEKISKCDIVFTSGINTVESLLCKKYTVIYDYGKLVPVNETNFQNLAENNFNIDKEKFLTIRNLADVIKNYNSNELENLYEVAKSKFDAKKIVPELLNIYKQTIENSNDEVLVIGCYPKSKLQIDILRRTIDKAKKEGIPVVICSHYPVPLDIQNSVDYVLYEKENILSGDYTLKYWFKVPGYIEIFSWCTNSNYQPVAILSSVKNALEFCRSRYSKMYYIESDCDIDIHSFLSKSRAAFSNNKKFVCFNWRSKKSIISSFFAANIDWFDHILDRPKSWSEYVNSDVFRSSELGRSGDFTLEMWLYTLLEFTGFNNVEILNEGEKRKIVRKRNLVDRGLSEPLYRVVLSETKNNKIIMFLINDSSESVTCDIDKDGAFFGEINIPNNSVHWYLFDKSDTIFDITFKNDKYEYKKFVRINSDKLYNNASFSFVKDNGIKAYVSPPDFAKCNQIEPSDIVKRKSRSNNFNMRCSFLGETKLEFVGKDDGNRKYEYKIADRDNGETIYKDILPINRYITSFRKWYTNYSCTIRDLETSHKLFQQDFDLTGKKVLISFHSRSLGDTLAWFPYVEEFRKKHSCQVVVSTFWNKLFEISYPDLQFVEPGSLVDNLYVAYDLGCFEPPTDRNKSPVDYRTVSLQKLACDILGLEYKEIRPQIATENKSSNFDKPYVCIAIHSTCQAKYWNYENGWQELVDFLNDNGYKVVLISRESGVYMNNKPPVNIVDKTGLQYSIYDRITDLKHAKFFIGLSSGLSWLAWSLRVPVVLISGHTKPWYEPQKGIYRVHNSDVCNGCYNDPTVTFDKGDWLWCPRHKDFECTKNITPQDVIEKCKLLI